MKSEQHLPSLCAYAGTHGSLTTRASTFCMRFTKSGNGSWTIALKWSQSYSGWYVVSSTLRSSWLEEETNATGSMRGTLLDQSLCQSHMPGSTHILGKCFICLLLRPSASGDERSALRFSVLATTNAVCMVRRYGEQMMRSIATSSVAR